MWFDLPNSVAVAKEIKEKNPYKFLFNSALLAWATCAWALLTRVALTQKGFELIKRNHQLRGTVLFSIRMFRVQHI